MDDQLHANICDLKFPDNYLDNDKIRHLLDGRISSEFQYACLHWATHLLNADQAHNLSTLLENFCFTHLLHWLEVLSLIGRPEVGYIGLDYAMRFTGGMFTQTQ